LVAILAFFVSTLAPHTALYPAMRTIPILIHPIGAAARLDNPLMAIIVTEHLPHH
jgi:hypothetical protein